MRRMTSLRPIASLVEAWGQTIVAFDAVHGRGASLREGRAICCLMAAFAAIAWAVATIWGDPI